MRADALATLLLAFATVFLLGAGLIVVAGRRRGPETSGRLWTAFRTEFLILAAVLVPAYLGAGPFLLSVAIIAGASVIELHRTLARTGLARWLRPAVLLVYPTLLAAHLASLNQMEDGFGYVAFLLALVEVNDSFALLAGTLVGGPKLWPRVSPNKTLAGSLAGLAATVAASGLLAFLVPAFSLPQALAGGLLIGIMGQTGDLVASAIKRAAGVKDFSSLIPAQGGVLDVYDALIFTAPFFYYYARLSVR
jgi:CDP-diglyceride synthetase